MLPALASLAVFSPACPAARLLARAPASSGAGARPASPRDVSPLCQLHRKPPSERADEQVLGGAAAGLVRFISADPLRPQQDLEAVLHDLRQPARPAPRPALPRVPILARARLCARARGRAVSTNSCPALGRSRGGGGGGG